MHKMSRREFFAESFGLLASASLLRNYGFSRKLFTSTASRSDLIIAHNGTPKELLLAALKGFGGIEKMVHQGQKVVIKVNISFRMTPEHAVTTNPELVETLINECRKAGAREVLVLDHTIHNWKMCMDSSQMKETVESAGGKIKAINYADDFKKVTIPRGKSLKEVYVSKDVLDADVFINVPIAKVHSSAVTTLSMKNLMGIVWDRGEFHMRGLHQCIADLSTIMKPDLIILDAYRILMTNGPGGPGEVKEAGELVVGTDPVAVDTYGSHLLDKDPGYIEYITAASSHGIGNMDMDRINTVYVDAQQVEEPAEEPQPAETQTPEPTETPVPESEIEVAEPEEPILEKEPVDMGEKEAGIPAVILIPALVVSFLIGLRIKRMKKKEDEKS
jgi:uncharacterized protein (DUF362 family)